MVIFEEEGRLSIFCWRFKFTNYRFLRHDEQCPTFRYDEGICNDFYIVRLALQVLSQCIWQRSSYMLWLQHDLSDFVSITRASVCTALSLIYRQDLNLNKANPGKKIEWEVMHWLRSTINFRSCALILTCKITDTRVSLQWCFWPLNCLVENDDWSANFDLNPCKNYEIH